MSKNRPSTRLCVGRAAIPGGWAEDDAVHDFAMGGHPAAHVTKAQQTHT